MDGQSRTCVEWMCNDEYEPGNFDLTNIMSPPDHDAVFFSMMEANPMSDDTDSGLLTPLGTIQLPVWGGCMVDTAAASAVSTTDAEVETAGDRESLVTLVQKLELVPPTAAETATAGAVNGAAAGPSLTEAVSEALSSSPGLPRVTSTSKLESMLTEEPRPAYERRQSISCPNTPPAPRRRPNAFFTESVFDPDRSVAISRDWQLQQQHQGEQGHDSGAAAANAAQQLLNRTGRAAESAAAGQRRLSAVDARAGAAPAAAAPRRRVKPRPSRLRELNFMAPTSM